VVALWAEQDVILGDEFRDGNVPAESGNRRIVEQALAALPAGVDAIRVRGDSALYDFTSRPCCAGWRRAGSAPRSAPT
jgi:hypothetical protein